jgi:peptidoglycan/xylan/chitin deacetylase (PgdA/CDA1 family)
VPSELYLTFDVEDFINDRSTTALLSILTALKKHNLKGLFFITGHMAEKLTHFPELINLLEAHEIGYHSTSHSVHPGIFEYTDIENYEEAIKLASQRETSHIVILRDMFPHKKIKAFRAPGFSWSPPHLEALRNLEIKYDFSTNLSMTPVTYKDIVFFPLPISIDTTDLGVLLTSVRRKATVLDYHPNTLVNKDFWDSPFFSQNTSKKLFAVPAREKNESNSLLNNLKAHLRRISRLQKLGMLEIGSLERSRPPLDVNKVDVQKVYDKIAQWPSTRFNYTPRFIYLHLLRFFELSKQIFNAP